MSDELEASGERFSLFDQQVDVTRDRVRWLVKLRWWAMAASAVATAGAVFGLVPGVAWELLAATTVAGTAYNCVLAFKLRSSPGTPPRSEALRQALVDLAMLTLILWAAGGTDSPFLPFYVFHVALIAILGGRRWALLGGAVALVGAGFLALPRWVPELRIGLWNPSPGVDTISEALAFLISLGGVAYIVMHAVQELREREVALAHARDQMALEYQLLSNTLDELHAGLEVVDARGDVIWRNRRAEELAPYGRVGEHWECPGESRPCERDVHEDCPVARARARDQAGRCRFMVEEEGDVTQVYEMLVFPIEDERAGKTKRVMNLYVDRTNATLAERKLLLAERLASLGRVAQGVAHELNTPLATIRTLATDMRSALAGLDAESEVVADLDESARLIRDETGRLGRITHAMLAGGDLVSKKITGSVPLAAAVERACAIVFAGARAKVPVQIDEQIAVNAVEADVDRVVQILVNLLQNAADAIRMDPSPPGTERAIRVRVDTVADCSEVEIVVEDDGPGLDPRILERLFEPFATTKPPGEGTGLGLYTSYMLAQGMGGELELQNRDPRGVLARLRLPAATQSRGGEELVTIRTRRPEHASAS